MAFPAVRRFRQRWMAPGTGKSIFFGHDFMGETPIHGGFHELVFAAVLQPGCLHAFFGGPVPIPVFPESAPQLGCNQIFIDRITDLFAPMYLEGVYSGSRVLQTAHGFG